LELSALRLECRNRLAQHIELSTCRIGFGYHSLGLANTLP
jgi:hypothetical protein